jgi:hypothetical protein
MTTENKMETAKLVVQVAGGEHTIEVVCRGALSGYSAVLEQSVAAFCSVASVAETERYAQAWCQTLLSSAVAARAAAIAASEPHTGVDLPTMRGERVVFRRRTEAWVVVSDTDRATGSGTMTEAEAREFAESLCAERGARCASAERRVWWRDVVPARVGCDVAHDATAEGLLVWDHALRTPDDPRTVVTLLDAAQ